MCKNGSIEVLASDSGALVAQTTAPSEARDNNEGLPNSHRVRCRSIQREDLPQISCLLNEGFPGHSVAFFSVMLDQLYLDTLVVAQIGVGFILECHGQAVGTLLTIYRPKGGVAGAHAIANVSCWFVRAEFTPYAALLLSRISRSPDSTIINISPAPNTWRTIEAQKFRRLTEGTFFCLPGLVVRSPLGRLVAFAEVTNRPQDMTAAEWLLLADHHRYGCIVIFFQSPHGTFPFVFREMRSRRTRLPFARLIYCRSLGELADAGGLIGRYLALKRIFLLLIASNSPIAGFPGKFVRNRCPIYIRGPRPPRVGDLSYTEAARFGI